MAGRSIISAATTVLPPLSSVSARYTIGTEIGRGGMGVVYEGTDVRLKRKVAIKFLGEGRGSADRRRRFLQEAQAASSLNHPNIVTIHDVDSANGVDFIVMEYVDGTPLNRLIGSVGLPLDQVLDYARQITSALAAAHGAGIIHRDLKPSNIIVGRDGRIKIVDFGLSKLTRPEFTSTEVTRSSGPETVRGIVMGSPGYMSLEQATGQAVDARSDVFSLGVVFFEMASGTLPFRENDLLSLLRDPPKSLLDVRADVPPALARVVSRCLEKEPAARYDSAIELQRELGAVSDIEVAAVPPAARARFGAPAVLAAAVALVVATAGLAAWIFSQRAQAERDHGATVEEAEKLVDAGRFVDVWRVAGAGLQRWPDDTRLQRAMQASTDVVTIATDPAGADVMFKAYTDVDGEWIPLGNTPLNAVRAPLGMLRWKVAKAGFDPLEARLEVGAPSAAAGRPDSEARPIRLRRAGEGVPGAVFVPGGGYQGKNLPDYWIDRTEVTNRDFKQFIDHGGYQNPTFWTELERASPSIFRRLGHAGELSDRTGRPGPSTWELGAYPEGQDDYPVSGVSWFEAVAYCGSVQKIVPTVFHWRRAFGVTFFMEAVTLGNFNGRGAEAVGRLTDLGPHGTVGMAGNIKEWVWNEYEGQRYILGGGWNEPIYQATNDDARPPIDRAEANGFRCMKEAGPSDASAFASWGAPVLRADASRLKPVSDSEFAVFRRFYAYDATPLDSKVERTEDQEHWRRERVSFAAAYGGERILANILLPKNVRPPYQVVIWFPGSYALDLKSSEGDLPFSVYFDFVARSGRALVYPVYSDMYERRHSAPSAVAGHVGSPAVNEARDRVVRWAKDFSRTVDYLETRSDLDLSKTAYYGYSLGAGRALPILGVEDRLKTAILLTGGLYQTAPPPEIDPVNFLPRVKLPVLMLGGRYDFVFPVETSQKPLFNLIATPPEHKRLVIFENAGHVPPRIDLIREVLSWLDRYLGPVQR
jgi:pimeloyl-ACP methyl ester carboxylesterase/predicted Ser/Thr protein kinase